MQNVDNVQPEIETLTKRLDNLEIKLSYMEDFVQQLQGVVTEHTKEIDLLRKENKLLSGKIRDMSEMLQGEIPNRKPPHY